MPFKIESFSFNLPFGIGGANVVRTEAQQRAAWALYVEYATRIASRPLPRGQGSAREALTSLHHLFDATRTVLKDLGPGVAEGPDSAGELAIRILNQGVRPFLTEWHTKLGAFETKEQRAQREQGIREPTVDEGEWSELGAFYAALETFRLDMQHFVHALQQLAGVSGG
ncbi:MAG: hypothetical protein AAF628_22050 [Planctomycetota bacterium]